MMRLSVVDYDRNVHGCCYIYAIVDDDEFDGEHHHTVAEVRGDTPDLARLLSAAPEMYDLLLRIKEEGLTPTFSDIEPIIAKVKGSMFLVE